MSDLPEPAAIVTADGPAGAPTGETDTPRPAGSGWRAVREWAVVIGVALGIALVVRAFVVAPFYIPSSSMYSTLHVKDRILVNKMSYRLHDVHRGDVVVFEKPKEAPIPDEHVEDLIKRVIGLPGDVVEFRDCHVYVNGQLLTEPYINGDCTQAAPTGGPADEDGDGKVQVPDNRFFVMGDNRETNASWDSRFWGFVPEGNIVGRAFVIIWPFGRVAWL